MADNADRSLNDLLAGIAAPTPAPGAGSTTAWTTAAAAALAEMAAGLTLSRADYSDRHPRMAEIRDRAAELRAAALELAEVELGSFGPVLSALRLPRGDPTRAERLAAALSDAAEAPLAVARVAAEVAQLCTELVRTGNPAVSGDAGAGAQLAAACCRAAGHLVELNLERAPDDPRLTEVAELARGVVDPAPR